MNLFCDFQIFLSNDDLDVSRIHKNEESWKVHEVITEKCPGEKKNISIL